MVLFSRFLLFSFLFLYFRDIKVVSGSEEEDDRISVRKCEEYKELITKRTQSCSGSSRSRKCSTTTTVLCDNPFRKRVVGGVPALAGEFPHMAAIGYEDALDWKINFVCGGSLISESHVLTAAHCFQKNGYGVVRLGVLDKNSETGSDFGISEFILHENYDRRTRQNDIAIVKLSRKVLLDRRPNRPDSANKQIRPACLWQTDDSERMEFEITATGWGNTEYGVSKASDILMMVKFDIHDASQCSQFKEEDNSLVIDDKQICAGHLAGGKDTCNGDSGGPISLFETNRYNYICVSHIIGVTSYGSQFCGSKNSPGIYTRVSSYLDWIEQKVWG